LGTIKNDKIDYFTWLMFLAFNISIVLIFQIFSQTLNIGELAYSGIALFLLSIFLIVSPTTPVKSWLVTYVSISLMIMYSAFWIYVLVSDFEWHYKLLSGLMLIPTPYYLIKTVVYLFRKTKFSDK